MLRACLRSPLPTISWLALLLLLLAPSAGCKLLTAAPPEGGSELTLKPPAGTTAADLQSAAAVVDARLKGYGLRWRTIEVQDGEVRVRVGEVRDMERVRQLVTRRYALRFQEVEAQPGSPPPDPADSEALGRWQAAAKASGFGVAVRWDGDGMGNRWPDEAVLLRPGAILESRHVAGARVDTDHTGAPVVSLEFDDEGRQRLADATGRMVGRRLAIVLDDELMSAPVVQERIAGGRAQVSFGSGAAPGDAEDLALALRTEELSVALELVSERIWGEP